jgi:hypothetical protein
MPRSKLKWGFHFFEILNIDLALTHFTKGSLTQFDIAIDARNFLININSQPWRDQPKRPDPASSIH